MHIQIPQIELIDSSTARIQKWGRVGSQVLRGGDRLLLGAETEDAILLLVPRGRGRPMLGRRTGGQLLAEPGRFPASSRRWRVQGAVLAIERDLERSVLGQGRWFLCSRLEGVADEEELKRFRAELSEGWRSASEVDAFTLRAALAPERLGLEVACAVASSPGRARQMLDSTPAGTIRIGVSLEEQALSGSVIRGPWPLENPIAPAYPRVTEAAGVQLGLFGDSPMMYAC